MSTKRIIRDYFRVIKGVSRRNRLIVPMDKKLTYSGKFILSQEMVELWYSLYKVEKEGPYLIPFSYHQVYSVRGFHRMIGTLQINFSKILHLRQETKIFAPKEFYIRNELSFYSTLDDIIPHTNNRVILKFINDINNKNGKLVAREISYFFVTSTNEHDLAYLEKSSAYTGKSENPMNTEIPKLDFDKSYDCKGYVNSLNEKTGIRFGEVSGDTNFIHTNKTIAYFFGYKKIFVQGLYMFNEILFQLHNSKTIKEVSELKLAFFSPVYLGEKVIVKRCNNLINVYNTEKKLLQSGTWL